MNEVKVVDIGNGELERMWDNATQETFDTGCGYGVEVTQGPKIIPKDVIAEAVVVWGGTWNCCPRIAGKSCALGGATVTGPGLYTEGGVLSPMW